MGLCLMVDPVHLYTTPTMYEHSDKNWEETLDVIKKLAEEAKS